MFENAELMVSCEDPSTTYLNIFDLRLIFREGKYIGWYRP